MRREECHDGRELAPAPTKWLAEQQASEEWHGIALLVMAYSLESVRRETHRWESERPRVAQSPKLHFPDEWHGFEHGYTPSLGWVTA